jgi:hypothetical protein
MEAVLGGCRTMILNFIVESIVSKFFLAAKKQKEKPAAQ